MDKLNGLKTIKSFNTENIHKEEFDNISTNYMDVVMRITMNRIKASLALEPLITILVVVLVVIAILLIFIRKKKKRKQPSKLATFVMSFVVLGIIFGVSDRLIGYSFI